MYRRGSDESSPQRILVPGNVSGQNQECSPDSPEVTLSQGLDLNTPSENQQVSKVFNILICNASNMSYSENLQHL